MARAGGPRVPTDWQLQANFKFQVRLSNCLKFINRRSGKLLTDHDRARWQRLYSDVSAAVDDCVKHGLYAGEMRRQLHNLNLEWDAMERDQSKIAASESDHSEPSRQLVETNDDRAMRQTKTSRRGPRRPKFEAVTDAMRRDIQEGRQSAASLREMLEKNLAQTYSVSRDTARKARATVLSELVDRQLATNDK
jgi:hypothetical protein